MSYVTDDGMELITLPREKNIPFFPNGRGPEVKYDLTATFNGKAYGFLLHLDHLTPKRNPRQTAWYNVTAGEFGADMKWFKVFIERRLSGNTVLVEAVIYSPDYCNSRAQEEQS